jgi:PIN domain nuclease of toxin-antitoxin system
VNLLLDTHAWLWWVSDDTRLSAAARHAIQDASREIYVSAATAMEIATKLRIGKLDEAAEAVARFDALIAADGFVHLPVTHFHGLKAGSYGADHRDPFDRLLAAQSELESLVLVTRDPAFAQFGARTLW